MEQVLDFLRNNKEVAFATSEGNRPKIRIFKIMDQESTTLYFATSPRKAVYKQLQENPYVEILAMDGQVSVRCTGKVSFDIEDEKKQWIYKNNPVLPRLYSTYNSIAYLSLSLEEIDYYDLQPTPPILRHFNLIEHTEGEGFVGERFSKKR